MKRPRFDPISLFLFVFIIFLCSFKFFFFIEFLHTNPLVHVLGTDDYVYWLHANRISTGQIIDDKPFLSAPLYPYILSVIIHFFPNIYSGFIFNFLLHIATAGILYCSLRLWFGVKWGLLGALLFLFSYYPSVNNYLLFPASLQVLLCTLLLYFILYTFKIPHCWNFCAIGCFAGLFSLAWPPAIAMLPVLIFLLCKKFNNKKVMLITAISISSILCVSIATLHNYIAANDFILISAHGGINFYQGNKKDSVGIYTPIEGVSNVRHQMYKDAKRYAENIVNHGLSWSQVDNFYYKKAFSWIVSDPIAYLNLIGKKIVWTFSSLHYDNVFIFSRFTDIQFFSELKFMPIHIVYLIGFFLFGVFLLRQLDKQLAWILFLLFMAPFIICIIFHFSSRYRIIAISPAIFLTVLFIRQQYEKLSLSMLVGAIALPPVIIGVGSLSDIPNLKYIRNNEVSYLANAFVYRGDLYLNERNFKLAATNYIRASSISKRLDGITTERLARIRMLTENKESALQLTAERTGRQITREITLKIRHNIFSWSSDYPARINNLRTLYREFPRIIYAKLLLLYLIFEKGDNRKEIRHFLNIMRTNVSWSKDQLDFLFLEALFVSKYQGIDSGRDKLNELQQGGIPGELFDPNAIREILVIIEAGEISNLKPPLIQFKKF